MANKKQLKDTDYLFISSYLRTRERNLLTAARMDRMIDAATTEEAAKVLGEIGYSEFSPSSERELSAALANEREKLFQDLYRFVPDKAVVDVFKVKYDYHNLKAPSVTAFVMAAALTRPASSRSRWASMPMERAFRRALRLW